MCNVVFVVSAHKIDFLAETSVRNQAKYQPEQAPFF